MLHGSWARIRLAKVLSRGCTGYLCLIPPQMASALLKFFSLSLLASTLALVAPVRRASVAYIAPASNGGSQLDSSAGLGEPLNVRTIFRPTLMHPSFMIGEDHYFCLVVSISPQRRWPSELGKARLHFAFCSDAGWLTPQSAGLGPLITPPNVSANIQGTPKPLTLGTDVDGQTSWGSSALTTATYNWGLVLKA